MKKRLLLFVATVATVGFVALNAIPVPEDPGVDIVCTEAFPMTENWGYCQYEYNMNPPFEVIAASCSVTDGYKNCDGVTWIVPN